MTRLSNIPHHEDFFKALKLTLNSFSIEHGVTSGTYFADKLHFAGNSPVQNFNKLINTSNIEKNLTVRELLHLLDNTPQHNKHTLDYLCNRYDLVCSKKASNDTQTIKHENIKNLLLNIAGSNGCIFSDFVDYTSDEHLDNQEIQNLIKSSYQTRALLNQFEHDLKQKLQEV